ncbi:putative mitochondrial adenine nucleotide transporter BTL3 isoform X2 [Tasmannia lanceolata]|uniref:putative mitochondrial adenine nucleotide transporter BTL3 isoform X2 n=1 Tax=Tasmannia lanceolata TaxID=3420 RepID=UPI0040639501
MHHFLSPTPTPTLQKYFPDLSLPPDPETRNDSLESPLLISVISYAILRSTHVEKSQLVSTPNLIFKIKKAIADVFVSRRVLQFNNNVQFVSLRARFARIKEKDEEEEEEDGESMYKRRAPIARNSKGKSSWSDMPKFLLAGAVSTIVSRTCVAPLERIKLESIIQGSKQTWINTIQLIWASEGLTGFWKGNVLNLFRMIPFKSINFICYDMYCDWLQRACGKKEITSHDRLIGGGISGITATALCLPLDTIRTRLIAPGGEALGGVVGCFFHMVHKEGFLSLYKGISPALISIGPASAIFYGVYDMLKASYISSNFSNSNSNKNDSMSDGGSERKVTNGVELGVVRTLIYASIAGACAETVTYPLEVIRRQLQLEQATRVGLVAAFIKLIERDGVGSLFAGIAICSFKLSLL